MHVSRRQQIISSYAKSRGCCMVRICWEQRACSMETHGLPSCGAPTSLVPQAACWLSSIIAAGGSRARAPLIPPPSSPRHPLGQFFLSAPEKKKEEKVRGFRLLLSGKYGVSRGVSCRRWSTKCWNRVVVQLNRLAGGNSAAILQKSTAPSTTWRHIDYVGHRDTAVRRQRTWR